MRRGFQRIGFFKVCVLKEEPAHLGHEENNAAEDEQEHRDGLQIVHRVIGVELDTVKRHAIGVFVLLDVNAVWVVRTDFVECKQVQYDKRQQHDRKRHNVQGKESV